MISWNKVPSVLAASGLAFSFVIGNPVLAQAYNSGDAPSVDTKVQQSADEQTTEKRKQVAKEAMGAIRETQNALRSLDENDSEKALAALESAAGKLAMRVVTAPGCRSGKDHGDFSQWCSGHNDVSKRRGKGSGQAD